jgi:hypothetical protein
MQIGAYRMRCFASYSLDNLANSGGVTSLPSENVAKPFWPRERQTGGGDCAAPFIRCFIPQHDKKGVA